MKVAVTGATGFIGRHVLNLLTAERIDLTAVTRHSQRLSDLDGPVHVGQIDLRTAPDNCFELLGEPDLLIHLAWDGLPNYQSLHHFEDELPNQYAFLKKMVLGGLASMLVVGTCFEYGMQSGPLSEGLCPQPNNPYGYAKDSLRRSLEFLQRTAGFGFSWVRLFYLYGPGQSSSSLYSQLQGAIAQGRSEFNMSGGEQLRDYLHVAEAARFIKVLALQRRDLGIVNVCSGYPRSVRSLVEGWVRESGSTIKLNLGHYPYPEYEPMAFWGDRTRLDSLMLTM